jgi:hypothetical protein
MILDNLLRDREAQSAALGRAGAVIEDADLQTGAISDRPCTSQLILASWLVRRCCRAGVLKAEKYLGPAQ